MTVAEPQPTATETEVVPATVTPAPETPGTLLRSTARRKVAVRQRVPRRAIPKQTVGKPPLLKVPPILLEGDEPDSPVISGPGTKFALGPETSAAHFAESAHLPATYGTGRLFLTARDPHWLYAHWDIQPATQFGHNAKALHRHLILRMHEVDLGQPPVKEIHVHPESRHWFAHVEAAGKRYVADLGYYRTGHRWESLAVSSVVSTPPDNISKDSTIEFATIPLELPFETMLALLEAGEEADLPLAQAVERLRARRRREFAPLKPAAEWTPEQERALAEILAAGWAQRAALGSQEITGPPGEWPVSEGAPSALGEFNLSSHLGGENVSSPLGEAPVERKFWFNVNAELIVYGATEPDAHVALGGKPVALRPDGSFRFRFALPDGTHVLPITAVAADGAEGRAVGLNFTRATESRDDVGAHPPDPELKPSSTETV